MSQSVENYILDLHDQEMKSTDAHDKACYGFMKRMASAYQEAMDFAEETCGPCAPIHISEWLGLLYSSFMLDRVKPEFAAEATARSALDFQDAVFSALNQRFPDVKATKH